MDCIASILDFYNKKSKDEEIDIFQVNKVYLSKLLIRVMKNFNSRSTNDFELTNCLILLVNVFSNNFSPDNYNHRGKDTEELINSERTAFRDILKSEFLG
jgi:hypothetical protein